MRRITFNNKFPSINRLKYELVECDRGDGLQCYCAYYDQVFFQLRCRSFNARSTSLLSKWAKKMKLTNKPAVVSCHQTLAPILMIIVNHT